MIDKSTPTGAKDGKKRFDPKAWWAELPAERKKLYVILGGFGGALLFAWMLVQSTPAPKDKTEIAQRRIQNALLPADGARDLGMAGVANELKETRTDNRALANKVERLEQMFERAIGSNSSQQQSQRLQNELNEQKKRFDELKKQIDTLKQDGGQKVEPAATLGSPSIPGIQVPQVQAPQAQPQAATIRQVEPIERSVAPQSKGNKDAQPKVAEYYMPMGSMLSGVTLTGADVPTGRGALKDPIPTLVRIKKEAVLPNRYRANVRECFVLLEMAGDLPSERAMGRSTGISCVRRDRTVLDVPIQGWVVGEDGRAGLRGRVVTKQGQMISKAMMAGFADGVSRAFGGNNQQGMRLDSGQLPEPGVAGASGIMGGASTALDRIAAFYLDLAEQLHPVIEIEAGRQVTIVLIRGRQMAGQSGAEK